MSFIFLPCEFNQQQVAVPLLGLSLTEAWRLSLVRSWELRAAMHQVWLSSWRDRMERRDPEGPQRARGPAFPASGLVLQVTADPLDSGIHCNCKKDQQKNHQAEPSQLVHQNRECNGCFKPPGLEVLYYTATLLLFPLIIPIFQRKN